MLSARAWTTGYAKIRFDILDLGGASARIGESLNPTELRELRKVEENFIYGLVNRGDLARELQVKNLTTKDLLVLEDGSISHIRPGRIKPLSGFDLIAAAKSVLPESEHWWNFRLFYDGVPFVLERCTFAD